MSSYREEKRFVFTRNGACYTETRAYRPSYTYDGPSRHKVMCRAWRLGVCKSSTCSYAHYFTEYLSPQQPIICSFWAQGHCSESADTCVYTHDWDVSRAQPLTYFDLGREYFVFGQNIAPLKILAEPRLSGQHAAIGHAAKSAGFGAYNRRGLQRLVDTEEVSNRGNIESQVPTNFPTTMSFDYWAKAPYPEHWSIGQTRAISTQPTHSQVRQLPENHSTDSTTNDLLLIHSSRRGNLIDSETNMNNKREIVRVEDGNRVPTPKRHRVPRSQLALTDENLRRLESRDRHTGYLYANLNQASAACLTAQMSRNQKRKAAKRNRGVVTTRGTTKLFSKVRTKLLTSQANLEQDRASMAKRWEIDERLKEPDAMTDLAELAEKMNKAREEITAALRIVDKMI